MSDKKKLQLGMNPSTASGRLVKDVLWRMVVETGKDKCFRCSKSMDRKTFSIEHKVPWLDSLDPLGTYFDLDNIAFSHMKCNFEAAKRPNKVYDTPADRQRASSKRSWDKMGKDEQKTKRREKYEKYGC